MQTAEGQLVLLEQAATGGVDMRGGAERQPGMDAAEDLLQLWRRLDCMHDVHSDAVVTWATGVRQPSAGNSGCGPVADHSDASSCASIICHAMKLPGSSGRTFCFCCPLWPPAGLLNGSPTLLSGREGACKGSRICVLSRQPSRDAHNLLEVGQDGRLRLHGKRALTLS